MDDFNVSTLRQCTNELCSRLLNIITPHVMEGIQSIFQESWRICTENKEQKKYLMTFQNLLCRIPKWNQNIIHEETRRIIEKSGCEYLEDLVTCVHIIQLKTLTAIRVGNKQKKIDISIPKINDFIHKVYIHVARKVYMNIYLFEKGITSLQTQKNAREFEVMVHDCILNAIRESIPTEEIIRAYMADENTEIEEEVIIEDIVEPVTETPDVKVSGENDTQKMRTIDDIPEGKTKVPIISNVDDTPVVTKLTFNEIDNILNEDNSLTTVEAPKDIERLEKISEENFMRRKLEEEESDDETDKIKIMSDISVDDIGIETLGGTAPAAAAAVPAQDEFLLDDIIQL